MAEIARHFLGDLQGKPDPDRFYRGWTFGEAWFKAFGANPTAALVRTAVEMGSDRPVAIGDAWLLQTSPQPGYVLSLVWAAEGPVTCERV